MKSTPSSPIMVTRSTKPSRRMLVVVALLFSSTYESSLIALLNPSLSSISRLTTPLSFVVSLIALSIEIFFTINFFVPTFTSLSAKSKSISSFTLIKSSSFLFISFISFLHQFINYIITYLSKKCNTLLFPYPFCITCPIYFLST